MRSSSRAFVLASFCGMLLDGGGCRSSSNGVGIVVDAFQPNHPHRRCNIKSSSSSSLQLLPGQGNQLKAAYEITIQKKQQQQEEEYINQSQIASNDNFDDDTNKEGVNWKALSSSKSFLTRVFHKKSVPHPILDKKDSEKEQEQQQHPANNKFSLPTFLQSLSKHSQHSSLLQDAMDEKNAVYYPLNGFQFVKGCEDALPTISHASIRMPTSRELDEVTYGWYSQSCNLDLYSEDICHVPTISDDTTAIE